MTAAPALPRRRRFQTSDGVSLSAIACGDSNAGPTLAFVPGWCMPLWLFDQQYAVLGRHHHVIALDPRGQGESDAPECGYTFERRSRDIHEFLVPYRNVLLVGWSLGALEILEYTLRFGEDKLAGMVLVDSSVGELPVPPPGGGFLDALRAKRDETLDTFVREMYTKARPEHEVGALLHDVKRMSLDNSIALLSSGIPREHWKECAHAFSKPLLYVVTSQFEEQAVNLRKNRPGTQIEVFKDAGHALFVDEPARFNNLLMEFAAQW